MEGRKRGSSYFVFASWTWTLFFFILKNPRGEILKSRRSYYIVVILLAEITCFIMKPLRKEIMSAIFSKNTVSLVAGVVAAYAVGALVEKAVRRSI